MYCVHPFVFFCYFCQLPILLSLFYSYCKINCNLQKWFNSQSYRGWLMNDMSHKIKFVIFLKSVVGLLFIQIFWIAKHIWAYCRATAKSIFLYTPYQVTFFANQLIKTKLGIILLVALIVFGVNCDMGRDDARKRLTLYSTKPFNSSLTLTVCHKPTNASKRCGCHLTTIFNQNYVIYSGTYRIVTYKTTARRDWFVLWN